MTLYHVSTYDLEVGDLLRVNRCNNPFNGRNVIYATREIYQSIIHVPISAYRDCGIQITDERTFFERTPGAFERAYDHSVFIYSVEDTDFERGPHGEWERVSFQDVVITGKQQVNALAEILRYQDSLIIHRYPNRPQRFESGLMDCDLLLKEVLNFLIYDRPFSDLSSRFSEEIQLPHMELNPLIEQIAQTQSASEILDLLVMQSYSEAAHSEWEKLMNQLLERMSEES